MSFTVERQSGAGPLSERVTFPFLSEKKRRQSSITALTACDYVSGRIVDQAGIDVILVGDSLGMVALGYDSTLPVTLDEMLHHTKAVRRGVHRALLVADMPFGTYHSDESEAVRNAIRFIKEGGAEAVKIEGCRPSLAQRLSAAEIPVVATWDCCPRVSIVWGATRSRGARWPQPKHLLPMRLQWRPQARPSWCWKGFHER